MLASFPTKNVRTWFRADLGFRTLTIAPCQAPLSISTPDGYHCTNVGCLIRLDYDHDSRKEALSIRPQKHPLPTTAWPSNISRNPRANAGLRAVN